MITTTPNTKRKAINEFFLPNTKREVRHDPTRSFDISSDSFEPSIASINPPKATPVPGLTLHPNFITPTEETSLLAYLNNSIHCTWRTDLSRRTMHFRGTYCLMPPKPTSSSLSASKPKPEILQAPPMPAELDWLIQRMVDTHIFPDDQRPQYCIVNEYIGNLGISAHTENFQFSEPVVGLSLLSECPMRFHELVEPCDGSVRSGKAGKAERSGRVVDVGMAGRSLLVMRGESRWRWQHEILRSRKGRALGWKRVSLTFRYKAGEKR